MKTKSRDSIPLPRTLRIYLSSGFTSGFISSASVAESWVGISVMKTKSRDSIPLPRTLRIYLNVRPL